MSVMVYPREFLLILGIDRFALTTGRVPETMNQWRKNPAPCYIDIFYIEPKGDSVHEEHHEHAAISR
ncbi:MAG: hypothetical protein ACK4RK_01900 [Gemmataceae bacterium]